MNELQGDYTSNISTIDALYGPGTMIGWYLTLLGCVLSWTFHPKRSRRDTIDADLVVAFILPVMAAIHLISLARQIPPRHKVDQTDIERLAEVIEAPLVVAETFMSIATWLFLIAIVTFQLKRAVVTVVVDLLCYAAVWYLFVGKVKRSGLLWQLNGLAIANGSLVLLGSSLATVFLVAGAPALKAMFYIRRPRPDGTLPESESQFLPTSASGQPPHRRDFTELTEMRESHLQQTDELNGNVEKSLQSSTMLFMLSSPLSLLIGLYGVAYRQNTPLSWIEAGLHLRVVFGPLVRFFPGSSATIRDSDQIVAALSGAIVFLFNLFSASKTRYQLKQEAKKRETEIRQRNDERMRRLLLHYDGTRQTLSEATEMQQ